MFSIWWIAAFILDIFAINHVMNSGRDTTSKVVLIVLILLVPFIASGLYLLIFRDKGYAI
jgi:Zn-dependent protease with chaperone function